MAHSNSTQYYSLPQFESTDKPAWLVDVNPAYAAIDAGIHAAKAAADGAQSDATQALSDAATADGKATTADAKASGAIASISESFDPTATYNVGEYVIYNNLLYICSVAVTTPGPWTGSSNWNRASVDSITADIKSSISNIKIEDLSDVSITSGDDGKLLKVNVNDSVISVSPVSINSFVKIYYFIGTTTANSNLDITGATGFDYTKETIVAVSARESSETNQAVVCTPYTYSTDNLGYITGLKCKSATENRTISNTEVDGYFWTIPRGTRGN